MADRFGARVLLKTVLIAVVLFSTAGARAQTAITSAEAQKFGEAWTAAIRAGDIAAAAKLLDFTTLIDTSLSGLSAPKEIRDALLQLKPQILLPIVNAVKTKGSYDFLHVQQSGGQFRPLIRLQTDPGLNYHELRLGRGSDGSVQAVDIDIYATGEPVTQTLRRAMLPAIASANQGKISRLLHGESEFVKHAADTTKMTQQFQAKDFAGCLATYATLPTELKKDKTFLLLHVLATGQADKPNYLNAIHEYEQTFSGDASGLLVSLDGLYIEKKYDELGKRVDELDKKLGGDPYLGIYRANLAKAKNNPAEAEAALAQTVKADPKLREAWLQLIGLTVEQKEYANTARYLTESERAAGFKWTNLASAPFYADFVKSPEYRKWAAARPKAPAATRPASAATPPQ